MELEGRRVGPWLSAHLAVSFPLRWCDPCWCCWRAQMSLRGSADWQGADGLSSPSAAQGQSGGAFGSTSPGPHAHSAEDGLALVDAKYPALLFKQQLTAYVEKLFGAIRDNLKKDITPLLQACIQVREPHALKALEGQPEINGDEGKGETGREREGGPGEAQAVRAW